MEKLQLGVSDCVALINQTLEGAYPSVVVVGEVSSFRINQNKFVFFDIKDEQSSLGCFMTLWQMRTPLEDGMKVEVLAQPKLTAWGKFSLTVREVRPIGEGSLRKAFELLKTKLQEEGLFKTERKRSLPKLPSRIGVISSTQAAGYGDFIKILNDRFGGLSIDVAHVQVQGIDSPKQLICALKYFNEQSNPPEVIAIVRGGGSVDDLAAFNDELLVRSIAASRVPTIIGVGHEDDITLADMAADVRAATPSNAAQILVPDKREITSQAKREVALMSDRVIRRYTEQKEYLQHGRLVMFDKIEQQVKSTERQLSSHKQLLSQINPSQVLRRGYAVVRSSGGVLSAARSEELQVNEEISVEMERVIIKAGVKSVQKR